VIKLFNAIQQAQGDVTDKQTKAVAARGSGKPSLPAPKPKVAGKANVLGQGKGGSDSMRLSALLSWYDSIWDGFCTVFGLDTGRRACFASIEIYFESSEYLLELILSLRSAQGSSLSSPCSRARTTLDASISSAPPSLLVQSQSHYLDGCCSVRNPLPARPPTHPRKVSSDPIHCHSLLTRGQWLDSNFTTWQPDGEL
jgi:hypothetical protein